ncbi:MAG: 7-carboxy-7-deazaguanine synthase QueE [Methylophilaceae bacterium]|nr:7-carboxy-7-deazaguanine synthase QueE [Methylophilaceae bacterium]
MSLKVHEIFYSLQGETSRSGLPTAFVRLTGCPLRCSYCDTAYAFQGGNTLSLDEILRRVAATGAHYVTVTGGEPLAQKDCLPLLTLLCDAGHDVSLETGGSLDITGVDPRVSVILDIKTPDSGEMSKNLWRNLEYLKPTDEVKFVLCGREDYEWARRILTEYHLDEQCPVLFSPVYGRLDPRVLAEWILADRLPVRFQLQLHKILWGEVPGR